MLVPLLNVEDLDFYEHLIRSITKKSVDIVIAYRRGQIKEGFHNMTFVKIPSNIPQKTVPLLFFHWSIPLNFLGRVKDVDVIFVLSELWSLVFAYKLSKTLGRPYVVWLRGNHRKVREARKVNFLKRVITNWLEAYLLNKASCVIPNSLSLRQEAIKWGVNPKKVMEPAYNGVDTDVFRPMEVQRFNEFTVGYAGRICPEKRVPELLEIAKHMKDIKFLIAGAMQMKVEFPENVIYLGKLSFNEMPRFYNMIDLLLLPSVTESFPSVILEAYACGKPVLATPEAFPKELEIFGAVAPLKNFESQIRKLRETDLKSIGLKARKYVEAKYTWNAFASTLISHMQKCVTTVI